MSDVVAVLVRADGGDAVNGWERVEREQAALLQQTSDPAFWRTYLTEHPEVLHQLIADIYRATSNSKERPSSLDDLWGLVNPTYSNEPFGQAVRVLLGKRSIRWLAGQLHMDHSALVRTLAGERQLISFHDPQRSMLRIEAVARALRVHPSYFQEWRRLWIMSLLDAAFTEQPHLSIGVWKKLSDRPAHERTLRA